MSIDLKTVKHISKLSRISLDEEKAKKLETDLNSIFKWIEQLNELKTENIEPLSSIAETKLRLRKDEIKSKNIREEILKNSPKEKNSIKGWESKGPKVLFDQIIQKKPQTLSESSEAQLNKGHFYITSDYCTRALEDISNPQSLWASGTKTMRKLAQNGYWVNGTADSFGESEILSLKESQTIQMLLSSSGQSQSDHPWWVLTNDQAQSLVGRSIPAYTRVIHDSPENYEKEIQETQVFYWTSYFQYEKYKERFPFIKDRIHCCGLGKTLENFKKTNTVVTPFADMDDFKSWINSSS